MTASFSRCNPRTVCAQTKYQTERIFLIARVFCTYSRLARVPNVLNLNRVRAGRIEKLEVIPISRTIRVIIYIY